MCQIRLTFKSKKINNIFYSTYFKKFMFIITLFMYSDQIKLKSFSKMYLCNKYTHLDGI